MMGNNQNEDEINKIKTKNKKTNSCFWNKKDRQTHIQTNEKIHKNTFTNIQSNYMNNLNRPITSKDIMSKDIKQSFKVSKPPPKKSPGEKSF